MEVNTGLLALALNIPVYGLALTGAAALSFLLGTYNAPQGLLKKADDDHEAPSTFPGKRTVAEMDGDFVIFIIGAAVHNWWDVRGWWPVIVAYTKIVQELRATPESGYLGGQQYYGNPLLMVQYWRSYDHLIEYARARNQEHYPAWMAFRRAHAQNHSVGIYHETYKVSAGQFEVIYDNMPAFGLGAVTGTIPIKGRHSSARGRSGDSDGSDALKVGPAAAEKRVKVATRAAYQQGAAMPARPRLLQSMPLRARHSRAAMHAMIMAGPRAACMRLV